jgi:glucose/arabinose dehydrogenase
MALLIVGAMTSVLGEQGHAASSKRPKRTSVSSVTRVEILASGFKAISGVAVEASGAVLVTDRGRGTLTRIDPSGARHRLLDRLHKPRAVAVDGAGDLLVLDEDGGRLLRLGADGSLSVVTSAIEKARA